MTSFARHAEACGFESVVLVEHAVVVSDYQSTYPYAPSGKMPLPDDCRIPDPLDLMAYLAGVTEHITLATGRAGRCPTIRRWSWPSGSPPSTCCPGGRVRMCLGVGWMDEELRATGADPRQPGPSHRRDRLPPCAPCGSDAGTEGADFDGEFFSFHHAHSFPKPVQPGGVPIHIGGTVRRRRGGPEGSATGSSPWGCRPEHLKRRSGWSRYAEARPRRPGRDPATIELSLSGYLPTTSEEDVLAAESVGAARLVVSTSMSARTWPWCATRCRPSPSASACRVPEPPPGRP
jgi:alkanesulfonate monooxygenase SsuD/methylene tetrahydromethanopterin reductase-like flavin-dependent oxidoreductase (luciferase family)